MVEGFAGSVGGVLRFGWSAGVFWGEHVGCWGGEREAEEVPGLGRGWVGAAQDGGFDDGQVSAQRSYEEIRSWCGAG